jgi:hypothetical protein
VLIVGFIQQTEFNERDGKHMTQLIDSDLLHARPSAEALKVMTKNHPEARVQSIADAAGSARKAGTTLNTDFFSVHITQMPLIDGHRLTASELMVYWKDHFNSFIDPARSQFVPATGDEARWASANPTGAVIDITLGMWGLPANGLRGKLDDRGAVLVSAFGPGFMQVTTVSTDHDAQHPVSGTREFGVTQLSDGTFIIYTRGADTPTGMADLIAGKVGLVFGSADALWRSFQSTTVQLINSLGGQAEIGPSVTQRNDLFDILNGNFDTLTFPRMLEILPLPNAPAILQNLTAQATPASDNELFDPGVPLQVGLAALDFPDDRHAADAPDSGFFDHASTMDFNPGDFYSIAPDIQTSGPGLTDDFFDAGELFVSVLDIDGLLDSGLDLKSDLLGADTEIGGSWSESNPDHSDLGASASLGQQSDSTYFDDSSMPNLDWILDALVQSPDMGTSQSPMDTDFVAFSGNADIGFVLDDPHGADASFNVSTDVPSGFDAV